MNEQDTNTNKTNSGASPAPTRADGRRRLTVFGWLMRLVSIATIAISCFTIAMFIYQDVSGQKADPIEDIVEPVVFSEPEPESIAAEPEPVSPVAITACISQEAIDNADHPLVPLIEMAKYGADYIQNHVQDYTAVITKQVRWKGKLQPEEKMFCKIRHQICDGESETKIPFSVYTRFIAPKRGQEAIWVKGCHDGKLVAHGPKGLLNLMTVYLEPDSRMAMSGNRYTIESIGMLNLIKKMVEQGTQDMKHEDCEVKLTRNFMVNDRRCTRLEIIHNEPAEHFEFHRAEIYIDDELNLPIAFRSFIWPDEPGGKPRLLERYYYTDIKINVGLTGADFDPANDSYDYPGL